MERELVRSPKYLYRIPNYYDLYKFENNIEYEMGTILKELEKMIKKSKLNKEELNDFLNHLKNADPKIEHSLALRTLTSPIRRDILQYIKYDIKNTEDIKNNFLFDDSQLHFHLNMLKQTYYITDSKDGWKLTPRGIGFLENAQLS